MRICVRGMDGRSGPGKDGRDYTEMCRPIGAGAKVMPPENGLKRLLELSVNYEKIYLVNMNETDVMQMTGDVDAKKQADALKKIVILPYHIGPISYHHFIPYRDMTDSEAFILSVNDFSANCFLVINDPDSFCVNQSGKDHELSTVFYTMDRIRSVPRVAQGLLS